MFNFVLGMGAAISIFYFLPDVGSQIVDFFLVVENALRDRP